MDIKKNQILLNKSIRPNPYFIGQENLREKKITSIRAPFRNMEEIIDIEFYLLKFHSTPCMGSILFLERINIKSVKIFSIELD